eukprot:CAMPEP_0180287690 /NCGR_PEP_ID=MMETSP0988-20121125/13535_1 /TAXON_ID=697907 /ORGANISM="non described non described, Strain CCMP2293" /LENGTH=31 /DNA_ID= /DNA_START= /DNA_END= /DNA_ORIENTATION=
MACDDLLKWCSDVQGYLAHKKAPTPRATMRP